MNNYFHSVETQEAISKGILQFVESRLTGKIQIVVKKVILKFAEFDNENNPIITKDVYLFILGCLK